MRFSQISAAPSTAAPTDDAKNAVTVAPPEGVNALTIPGESALDALDFDSAPEPMFPMIGITPGNQGGGLRLIGGTKEDESLPQGMVKCPIIIIGWRTSLICWAKQKDETPVVPGAPKDKPEWTAYLPASDIAGHSLVLDFLNGGKGRCGYSFMRKADRARFDAPASVGHVQPSIEVLAYYAKAQKLVVFAIPGHSRNWTRTLQALKAVDPGSKALVTLESSPQAEKGSITWTSHAFKLTRGVVGGKPGDEAKYMEGYAAFAAASNADAQLTEKVTAWITGGEELLSDEKRQAILAATATLPLRTR